MNNVYEIWLFTGLEYNKQRQNKRNLKPQSMTHSYCKKNNFHGQIMSVQ